MGRISRGKSAGVRPLNQAVNRQGVPVDALPKTYGEIEGFVTMLLAACDDAGMNGTLERLLSLPDGRRQQLVQDLLAQFRQQDAPAFLLEAFAPLLDDEVAEKAYVVLYECKRKMDSAG